MFNNGILKLSEFSFACYDFKCYKTELLDKRYIPPEMYAYNIGHFWKEDQDVYQIGATYFYYLT